MTAFALQPLNWIVGFLLWAVFTRREKRRKRLLVAAIALLLVFTNPFLLNCAHRWWEPDLVTIEDLDGDYDLAIVLGGFSRAAAQPRDRTHFSASADRLTHALELYRLGRVKRIMISGGAGVVVGEKVAEADGAKRFLVRAGVPEEDVWTENQSRNTRENAVNTAAIVAERLPGEARLLLFTDATHMPRATGCFRKAGLDVDAFPVSEKGGEPGFTPDRLVLPSAPALGAWNRLIREWVGTLVYRVRGYI